MTKADRPVKVLHVFGRMDRGGAEMRTLDVMRNLDPCLFHLDFCSLSGLPGDLDDEIAALGGTTHLCKLDIWFPIRFILLLEREHYDVVHSHVMYVSGFILVLAQLARVPNRIAHFRSTGSGLPIGIVRRLRDRVLRFAIGKSATHILAVSNGVMVSAWTSFVQGDDRCLVVHNGIQSVQFPGEGSLRDLRESLGLSEHQVIVIHVGRFNDAKNHEKLLRVFAEIHVRDPSSVLLLIGGGSITQEAKVRSWVDELRLSDSVRLLGVRSDVPMLLMMANAMIFPSHWEGLPGAVLEACAAGTPVIGSNISGVCEIAKEFNTVRCLDLNADNRVWADALEKALLMGGCRRHEIEAFGSSRFTLDSATKQFMKIWRDNQHADA